MLFLSGSLPPQTAKKLGKFYARVTFGWGGRCESVTMLSLNVLIGQDFKSLSKYLWSHWANLCWLYIGASWKFFSGGLVWLFCKCRGVGGNCKRCSWTSLLVLECRCKTQWIFCAQNPHEACIFLFGLRHWVRRSSFFFHPILFFEQPTLLSCFCQRWDCLSGADSVVFDPFVESTDPPCSLSTHSCTQNASLTSGYIHRHPQQ